MLVMPRLPAFAGTSLAGHPATTSFDVVLQRQPRDYWIANRNRMLPISILLVSAEVGQARLPVKPGDDTQAKRLFCGVSIAGARCHDSVTAGFLDLRHLSC